MSGLALLLLFEGPERFDPRPLLKAAAGALTRDEGLILVDDGAEPGRAFAARLWQETEGWPKGLAVTRIDLPPPGGIRPAAPALPPGTAQGLGLAALETPPFADITHVLTLDGRADPADLPAALRAIRRRLVSSGAEVLALTADREMPEAPLPVLRRCVLSRAAARAGRGVAGGADPAPVALALAAGRRSAALRVGAGLLPPLPEGGPALAQASIETVEANPDTKAFLPPSFFGQKQLRVNWPQAKGAEPLSSEATPPAPFVARQARLRLWIDGPHRHRTPLSYLALRPLWEEAARLADHPDRADMILWAHPGDPVEMGVEVARAIARRPLPLVLMSEEPLWDTLYSPAPLDRAVTVPAGHLGELRLHQVTHHRSTIFDFARIPYYLLTEHRFATAYARRFAANAALSPADWQARFAARPKDVVFMAERREEAFHDLTLPEGGIQGLCAWRTRLATATALPEVERLGASWQATPRRQDLADWHLDKLVRLKDRARLISAVENTHQPLYLSEKLFDAFACGARPLYMAAPGHSLHRLELPEGSWVNLWGQSAEEAAAGLADLAWDEGVFRAYAEAQSRLAALFTDPAPLRAERARLGAALKAELTRLAEDGPAL